MRTITRYVQPIAVVALLFTAGGASLRAQTAAAPERVALTPEQMEAFLLNAKIVRMRSAGDGVTNSRRATMTDGTLTHDAHVQVVDEAKALFDTPKGAEINFKDTYRYNIAAYRLARLLDLDNVPMSVERRVEGKPAAVTWWVDDVMMDEGDRVKKKARDPVVARGTAYTYRQRVFDELIQNRDRNLGNLIYTSEWKMWMIDHTRAFRLGKQLLKPERLTRIERPFLERLQTLTQEAVTQAVGGSLTRGEVDALIARRGVIVKAYEDRIAKTGEAGVLITIPR